MTIPTAGKPPSLSFAPSDHTGSLVRIVVHSYDPAAMTQWGEKATAVVDIDVIEGRVQQGQHFGPQYLSGTRLAPQLGEQVGHEVYGRIEAIATGGANPAMQLSETLSPRDIQTCVAWREWMGARLVQPNPNASPAGPGNPARQAPASTQQWTPPTAGAQTTGFDPQASAQGQQSADPYAGPTASNGQPGWTPPQHGTNVPAATGSTDDPPF